MRKLVLILIAFIAVVTFIRAFDNSAGIYAKGLNTSATTDISENINDNDTESGN